MTTYKIKRISDNKEFRVLHKTTMKEYDSRLGMNGLVNAFIIAAPGEKPKKISQTDYKLHYVYAGDQTLV